MKEKNLITYVNVALAAVLLAVLALSIRSIGRSLRGAAVETREPEPHVSVRVVSQGPIYAIKEGMGGSTVAVKDARSLNDIYADYPASDVGSNMMSDWQRIGPTDKTKFIEVVDKKIADLRERLKMNPDDREAKRFLFISESMKSLALNGFNYEFRKDKQAQAVIANPPKAGEAISDETEIASLRSQ